MNVRRCKCGCGASLDDRRSDCVWATSSCSRAWRDGVAPAQRGKQRPGGAQVSYSRAVEATIAAIWRAARIRPHETLNAQDIAEQCVSEALPVRQRARLETRNR